MEFVEDKKKIVISLKKRNCCNDKPAVSYKGTNDY